MQEQTAPTHLSQDAGGAAFRAVDVIRLLLTSMIAAILLEAGTVFGTPGADILSLAAWSKTRLVIFFLLALVVIAVGQRRNWIGRFVSATRRKASWVRNHIKPIIACTTISLVAAIVIGTAVTVLTEFSEPELLFPFLFILFANVTVIVEMVHQHSRSYEAFFLFLLLSVGIWFCVASPVKFVYSYDDETHYAAAESLSYITAPVVTSTDVMINTPENRNPDNNSAYSLSEEEESYEAYNAAGAASSLQKLPSFSTVYGGSILSTAVVGYLPSAAGLWVGRLLHLPFTLLFVLGKLANLLFYGIVIYRGMKYLASKRCLMGAIAISPISLFLACSYSYDPWIIALSVYAFCRFVAELEHPEQSLTRGTAIGMIGTLFLAFLPKAIYFPMVLLLLLMPKAKFASRRSCHAYRLAICGASLLLLLSFVLPMLVGGAGTGDARGGSGVNSTGQISYILSDMPGYLSVLVSFALSYVSPSAVSDAMVFLGYLGPAPVMAIPAGITMIALAVFDTDSNNIRQLGHAGIRIAATLLFALTVGLVCTALYISYTAVGSETIAGVQGRYLIPLLFPLLALLPNLRIPYPKQSTLAAMTACANVFILFGTLAIVFLPKFVA